jgi:hypothetical protein
VKVYEVSGRKKLNLSCALASAKNSCIIDAFFLNSMVLELPQYNNPGLKTYFFNFQRYNNIPIPKQI